MVIQTVQLIIFVITLLWSAYQPHDYPTWWLEVFPALLGMLILIYTYRRFSDSEMWYRGVLMQILIFFIGGP